MGRLSIRLAEPSDFPSIGQLHALSWQSAYGENFSPERLYGDLSRHLQRFWNQHQVRSTDIIMVAESTGEEPRLLGFCAIWCRDAPYLDNLHVNPADKGIGVGRALLAAAARELTARGHGSLWLSVFETNRSARAFYARMGGTEAGTFDEDVYGEPVRSMKVVWNDLSTLMGVSQPRQSRE